MKILVIGGAGFIGSHTVDALVERGHDVAILDNYTKRTHGPKLIPEMAARESITVVGDASQRSTVERALRGIETVYHFAAYQDYLPDFSTFVRVNVESVALLYEVIVDMKLPIQKVILASSQAVYGEGDYYCRYKGRVRPLMRSEARLREGKWAVKCPGCGGFHDDWTPTSELTEPEPHNVYGLSKLAGEQVAISLGAQYGIPTVVLRYSIVQGSRQSFYNAYSGACRIFCLAAHLGLRPTIYEDGRQVRDYVNIHDVVEANLLALDYDVHSKMRSGIPAVFNVGGGKPVTVLELVETVSRVYGKPLNPEIPGKYRFGDVRHVVSDITRLEYFGWSPKRTVEDSVREYKAWLETLDPKDTLSYAAEQMARLGVVRKAHYA